MKKLELRLSGFGGQGLITAGIILAEAAILDGKNAVQSQSYGPEARGGASKAEVIISSEEIDYPKVGQADLCLAMSQQACDKYAGNTQPNGVLVLDSGYVKNPPEFSGKMYSVPITEIATSEVGRNIVANIVALGVIAGVTNVVTRESLETAVLDRVPPHTKDLNKKALAAGYESAKNLLQREGE
ncbi:MAG TPA: 2-oxoacid:ferredoxin oxidoreductase subunit gamma [Firmicutes bacterium]|nr:2-oxoacid:ferredoxin oxidoreductase subunit gamma [Bacillota bacterium]